MLQAARIGAAARGCASETFALRMNGARPSHSAAFSGKNDMESRNQLVRLREYQEVEREIAELEERARAIPKTLEAIEEEAEAARSEQTGLENRRKDIERERMRRESDLEAERERMRKTQGKQLEVKTNKEYSALLQEIEGVKENIDRLETEILELMEEGEAIGGKIDERAARVREKETEAEGRKKAKREELAVLEGRLAGLENDRKHLSRDIDDDWAANYNRIKASRGWAVSPLNGNSCGGCHQLLMPQLIHEIKHGDDIKSCPYCMRILYALAEGEVSAEAVNPAESSQA